MLNHPENPVLLCYPGQPSRPLSWRLADGTVFIGNSIGATGTTVGEVVFNTAITGYQEILTDPSYCQQIVTLTYPHIGNYGVNAEDVEAEQAVHAAGLIIRRSAIVGQQLPPVGNAVAVPGARHRRHRQYRYPQAHPLAAQQGRAKRRDCWPGCRSGGHAGADRRQDRQSQGCSPTWLGLDWPRWSLLPSVYAWTQTEWKLGSGYGELTAPQFHVVAYDFGVKKNILRMLAERGCKVTVVPAETPAADVLALNPDGVFLSNGPGDPAPCDYAIEAARTLMDSGMPTFGICLGHQIMALASGASRPSRWPIATTVPTTL